MADKWFFLSLILATSSGKNRTMLSVKTLVRVLTRDVVPTQLGGREEYMGLLLKNIFSPSIDSATLIRWKLQFFSLEYRLGIDS